MRRSRQFRPFAFSSRRMMTAIFLTFGLSAALTVTFSVLATRRSQNRATIVEVAGRQRTLAERYVKEVLLVRAGERANPSATASILAASTRALLDGGVAPAVPGDDDATRVGGASGSVVRSQLLEEQRLVSDLSAYGAALLAHEPLAGVAVNGGERVAAGDPLQHLRVLGALTSAVALNIARSLASQTDANIDGLIGIQIGLGAAGLLISLLLAAALIAITRRQGAHFRSLVTASSDLVVVLGTGGCRYASRSLQAMVGRTEHDLLGAGFEEFVHEDDREMLAHALETGEPPKLMLRVHNAAGEWRHLSAVLTDRRGDRYLRGVMLNARDVTERVRLEQEVALQAQRDTFGSQLVEALEMADEERSVYEVVERAMIEIAVDEPMELLLSDSSRAHLERAATSPTAGAPLCPVQSPFSCVAVRRGNPVVFESSESLNACPKLRGREAGRLSAACVPVGFMGRALGVLHATAAEGAPPAAEQIAQLTTLATQAGARIGTVRAFERSQIQASTDTLTGLVNRRTFESQVRELLNAGRPLAVAVADLDHFKAINDAHGHEAGDRALRLFAHIAQESLREHDVLARWGGEEFAFAFADIDREIAISVLDRLRAQLAAAQLGNGPRFTASFGVTDTQAADNLDRLVAIADGALYESKRSGRDRVTVASTMPEAAEEPAPAPAGGRTATDGAPHKRAEHPSAHRPSRRGAQTRLHEAADGEDPRPSGLEIR